MFNQHIQQINNSHPHSCVPPELLGAFPALLQVLQERNCEIPLNMDTWYFDRPCGIINAGIPYGTVWDLENDHSSQILTRYSPLAFSFIESHCNPYTGVWTRSFLTKQLYISQQHKNAYITAVLCNVSEQNTLMLPAHIWTFIFSFYEGLLKDRIYHRIDYYEQHIASEIRFHSIKTSVHVITSRQSSQIYPCSKVKNDIYECTVFNSTHNPKTCIECKNQATQISVHLTTCIKCRSKTDKLACRKPKCYTDHQSNDIARIECTDCRTYDIHLRNCIKCLNAEIHEDKYVEAFEKFWMGEEDGYRYNSYDYDYAYSESTYEEKETENMYIYGYDGSLSSIVDIQQYEQTQSLPEFKLQNESTYCYKKHVKTKQSIKTKDKKHEAVKQLYNQWTEHSVKPRELYKRQPRRKFTTKQFLNEW